MTNLIKDQQEFWNILNNYPEKKTCNTCKYSSNAPGVSTTCCQHPIFLKTLKPGCKQNRKYTRWKWNRGKPY